MSHAPLSIAQATHMYSGAKTGLVLTDIQQEQQELKKRDQETLAFEGKNVKIQRLIEAHLDFIFLMQFIVPDILNF